MNRTCFPSGRWFPGLFPQSSSEHTPQRRQHFHPSRGHGFNAPCRIASTVISRFKILKSPYSRLSRSAANPSSFIEKGHPEGPPLTRIARFTARESILGLLARHASLVRLEGLDTNIPPKDSSNAAPPDRSSKTPYFGIGEIIADGARLPSRYPIWRNCARPA